jgi:hypothetical protein
MNRWTWTRAVCVLGVLMGIGPAMAMTADADPGWKAGVASVVITPEQSIWLAGYAARTKPSEGKFQDLFAKALAVEDAGGTRLVIVTLDLIGISRGMRGFLAKQAEERYRLPPQSLLVNASHTHSGPVVREGKSATYSLNSEQDRQVEQYAVGLKEKLVVLIGDALKDLARAKLSYSHARAGFAMNRRLPTPKGYQNSPYPDGPVDHDVPVLRVDRPDGKFLAVLFGYACHNTTLGDYQFSGDYAGYAQQYLEEAHPGMKALFMIGCGGDQNPYPRRTVALAEQHGRALANAVETALLPKPRPVAGPLRTALAEVPLDFVVPSREELLKQKESKNKYEQRHATLLLEKLDQQGKLPASYPYLVQVVQLGKDLTLVALAGEVVVDYSLRLKRELPGTPVWVAGYSNDVFGYVPSERVLSEGGYEGREAMIYTSNPGPFAPTVEERIVGKVHELVKSPAK